MAEEHGWILIQDTAWPGYEEIPAHIMQGLSLIHIYADLLLVTGMADAVALEDVLRLVAAGPRRRVGDHQGSAAGSVHLPAVMALHDLDVIADVYKRQPRRST